MGVNVLVLARWEEDIEWSGDVSKYRDWVVDVVQKGVHCPDMGKEAGGYLHWIVRNYYDLQKYDSVCFSQAWPFDHVPYMHLRDVTEFTPLGDLALAEPEESWLDFTLEDVVELYLKEPYPDENVMFPMGACFIVPVGKILSRSCSTYKALYDFVMQTPELHSHVLERMWPIIFHN